jgi:hypothetical protein
MSDVRPEVNLSWTRAGGWCGVASVASYLLAAFAPLPDTLSYAAAFAFGPLLAVGAMGLARVLALDHDGPRVQIARMLAVAAGVTVLLMLTTQQAIFGVVQRATEQAADPAAKDVYAKVGEGLDAVHFGIDVAWDVLISAAVVLFGLAMWRHPAFGRVMGGLGVALGGLLLGFNLWSFPRPPAAAGAIDWGPFVALWLLGSFLLLLRAGRWVRQQALL